LRVAVLLQGDVYVAFLANHFQFFEKAGDGQAGQAQAQPASPRIAGPHSQDDGQEHRLVRRGGIYLFGRDVVPALGSPAGDSHLRADHCGFGDTHNMREDTVPKRIQSRDRPVASTRLGGRFPAVVPRPAFPWWWVAGAALLLAAVCLFLVNL
jgi:hypothetical protein